MVEYQMATFSEPMEVLSQLGSNTCELQIKKGMDSPFLHSDEN